jgi:hypothetical protein
MRSMSTDLSREDLRPYFLWDEDMSVAEFRERLGSAPERERLRLLARLLREARDTDVWRFVSPQEVADKLPELERHLGRRRSFWRFLLGLWKELGLVR